MVTVFITASTTVRNLGVELDIELNFDDQARWYRRVIIISVVFCKFGAMSTTNAYAVSYTPLSHTSRLDYCNSLYARCNASVLQGLQRVQNCAARYILNAPPRSPSLPLLHHLHWLPIESRICYKLCSLMYRVNHSTAPSYLSELCVPCSDTRLRSTTRGNYIIPRTQ